MDGRGDEDYNPDQPGDAAEEAWRAAIDADLAYLEAGSDMDDQSDDDDAAAAAPDPALDPARVPGAAPPLHGGRPVLKLFWRLYAKRCSKQAEAIAHIIVRTNGALTRRGMCVVGCPAWSAAQDALHFRSLTAFSACCLDFLLQRPMTRGSTF